MLFLRLFFQLFLILFAMNCGGRTEIEGIGDLIPGTGTGPFADTTKYYYLDGSQWEPLINGIAFDNYKSNAKKRWIEIEFIDGVLQSGVTFFDLNGDVKNANVDTIRGKYAIDLTINTVHASDSIESAQREINLFQSYFNNK